jgi:hypothetical protein
MKRLLERYWLFSLLVLPAILLHEHLAKAFRCVDKPF